jgi:hypothetical protein
MLQKLQLDPQMFAIAPNRAAAHKGRAFQASSPKPFKAGPRVGPFFCPTFWYAHATAAAER